MGLQTNKRIVLAKLESVYGTDPTPDGSDAMLVGNLNPNPLNAELVQRNLIRPYFGNSDTLIAQASSAIEFEVELAGSGIRGNAPAWARLLKACGFGETINTTAVTIAVASEVATVTKVAHGRLVGESVVISGCTDTDLNGTFVIASVADADTFTYAAPGASDDASADGTPLMRQSASYAPISSSLPSLTFYYNVDGVLHKMTGARGSVEFTVNVKNIPVMKFTFLGIYNAPSDTAAATPDFTGFQQPKVANTSNTTAFSLHSYSGYLEQLVLNMACDVQYRTLIGAESVIIADRKPAGSIVIEAPTVAQKDYFTSARAGTTGTMSITHGTANGNKVTIAASRVSIGNPQYQDSQGTQMLNIPIVATPSSGNDEVTITAA